MRGFDLSEFGYTLPIELIAQKPQEKRDESRLLILDRQKKTVKEGIFKEIVDFLEKGDVLVLNDTKVIPARIFGRKQTGAKIEVLLLREIEKGLWEALIKPAKRIKLNQKIFFNQNSFWAELLEKKEDGINLIKFNTTDIKELLNKYGKLPIPHYIKKYPDEPNRYQTVYAQKEGAVASPTAGLHFTEELLEKLKLKGINIVYITLHCGLATFRPIKEKDIRRHKMPEEYYQISEDTAKIINQAKKEKRRVFACGTTTTRALETASFLDKDGIFKVKSESGNTKLFIYPGYQFKIIDGLITNFHLPYSTNLILVASFCGLDFTLKAYQYAIERKFRFYSFGDAMLII